MKLPGLALLYLIFRFAEAERIKPSFAGFPRSWGFQGKFSGVEIV
jgi:hypothetical protein